MTNENFQISGEEEIRCGSPLGRRRSSEDALASSLTAFSPAPRPSNGSPVSDWLGRIDGASPGPERPSSSTTVRHGFDDLFPEVVPPKRPLTPSPELQKSHKAMDSVPVRPTARRTSEAVAIERIFQNFSLGSSDLLPPPEETLQTAATQRSLSPLQSSSVVGDNDQIFKSDLANVLVWFENDLTNSQRITTAFTLLNHLTTWQLRFVLSLLSKPSEDHVAEAKFIESVSGANHGLLDAMDMGPPPGFVQPVAVEAPTLYHQKVYETPKVSPAKPMPSFGPGLMTSPTMSCSSSANSVSATTSLASSASELTLEQCNPDLFDRDIQAWLRSLRLHKYSLCFQSMKQSEILTLVEEQDADARLEKMGVSALGARRKILRVLATIKASK